MVVLFFFFSFVFAGLFLDYETPGHLTTEVILSQCAHRALEGVIEECASGGVEGLSPNLRKKLAVMLSICEFQDAEVDYPDSCKLLQLDTEYHQCVQDLRKISQFWTTYLGNYRKIKTICHEEAMPFFKEHVLNLFNNITRDYAAFYEASYERSRDVEKYQEEAHSYFEAMFEEFELMIASASREREKLETDAAIFRERMLNMFDEILQDAETTANITHAKLNSLSEKALYLLEVAQAQYDRVAEIFAKVSVRWVDLQTALSNDMDDIVSTVRSLKDLTSDVEAKELDLHDLLDSNLQLSTEFHHRIRGIELDFEQYFESQGTRLLLMIDEAINTLNSHFEYSISQIEDRHFALKQNIEELDSLMVSLKLQLESHFSDLQGQITSMIVEIKSSSFFGPLTILRWPWPIMISLSVISLTTSSILSKRLILRNLIEFCESVLIGVLLALACRFLWKVL